MTFMDVLNNVCNVASETFDKNVIFDVRNNYAYHEQGVTAYFFIEDNNINIQLYDVETLTYFYHSVVPAESIDPEKGFIDYIYDELDGNSVVEVIVDQANYTEAKSGLRIALERILKRTYDLEVFSTDSIRKEAEKADNFDTVNDIYTICMDILETKHNAITEYLKPHFIRFNEVDVNVILSYTETNILELTGAERTREALRLLSAYVDICNNEVVFVGEKVIITENISLLELDASLGSAIALAHRGVFTCSDIKRNIDDLKER